MTQTVLVTGANGFIGSTLCIDLARRGYAVRTAVRELSRAIGLPGEMVLIADIGAVADWSSALAGVDSVVHLAARVHVMQDSAADPLTEFRKINVEGTLNLAQQAAEAEVRRFIFVSSIKVNGEGTPLGQPFTEEDSPNPQDAYAQSKWEEEQTLMKVSRETGLEIVILRLPLVYGSEVKANFLRLMQWVAWGVPLPLGAARNQRSLVYLGNLVSAIDACLTHPSASNQTYLVSDGEDLSTTELIRRIAQALGRSARLFSFPPFLLRMVGRLTGKTEKVDRLLNSLVIDSSKIFRELNWTPPYSVEQGLAETAKWFLDQGNSLK